MIVATTSSDATQPDAAPDTTGRHDSIRICLCQRYLCTLYRYRVPFKQEGLLPGKDQPYDQYSSTEVACTEP